MNKWNRQYTTNCPCRDCKERHACCHDDCERYRQFSKENAENAENERKRIYNEYILSRTKPMPRGGKKR